MRSLRYIIVRRIISTSFQSPPNPWAPSIARWSCVCICSFDGYAGRSNRLKQVWALGRRVVSSIWVEMRKTQDLFTKAHLMTLTINVPYTYIWNHWLTIKTHTIFMNILSSYSLDAKMARTIWTLQALKSLQWHTRRASTKLEELPLFMQG